MVTTFPPQNILHKLDLFERLAKWAIKLIAFDITYQPRTAIKSQVLINFVADFSAIILPEAEKEVITFRTKPRLCTLYNDDP